VLSEPPGTVTGASRPREAHTAADKGGGEGKVSRAIGARNEYSTRALALTIQETDTPDSASFCAPDVLATMLNWRSL